jgi:hypothetical protein
MFTTPLAGFEGTNYQLNNKICIICLSSPNLAVLSWFLDVNMSIPHHLILQLKSTHLDLLKNGRNMVTSHTCTHLPFSNTLCILSGYLHHIHVQTTMVVMVHWMA